MAHELDMTTGKAGIAYVGKTPWHGLGQQLTPNTDLLTWQQEAGLDWEAKMTAVMYHRDYITPTGTQSTYLEEDKERKVLYRSDNGAPLSIVSNRYRPVQPGEIIEFYRDLTERHGFQMETAGSLKGGRRIWALANTNLAFDLKGQDTVKGYLLLATSFDGTMATQARFTSIRVVCNNTLSLASGGKPAIAVPHSTTFDADAVKMELGVGDVWEEFQRNSQKAAARPVDQIESAQFFLDVYLGLKDRSEFQEFLNADERNEARADRLIERMRTALFNSPGAHLESARGMLWGLLSAVTYDVDHAIPARTQENRLDRAWFGDGDAIKRRAYNRMLEML